MVLSRKVQPVFRRYGVRFAYLWGSRARGCAGPRSDYDIAVEMGRGSRRLEAFLDLSADLSRVLRTDDVDVTLLDDANLEVRFLVQHTGRLLFDAVPDVRMEFERVARREYWDESFRLRRYDEALYARVREGTFGT